MGVGIQNKSRRAIDVTVWGTSPFHNLGLPLISENRRDKHFNLMFGRETLIKKEVVDKAIHFCKEKDASGDGDRKIHN
ncbi:hypothetical protein YC2023_046116 [Brassica napus]